ncbi:3-hydroxyacyl-CoA dehydrogenase NAD-binding domain-containing protein [Jonesia quinghaiensis]|uniref:3-hydroxyacyl-CoA dehydrogenase NAD-binding domain-containing protein n=1 Tax=Jonesia quinghaiensis TaxID=262806 RepID=UPI00041CD5F1|nr:3-hydroxyacyl-CoA dehydrogenase NAD-binding domain-containing protein [Jonesia quinghaiensis]
MSEIVTHAYVRDIELPQGGGTLALITLDNGEDHTRPTTLGEQGIANMTQAMRTVAARADAGDIAAVGITGKPHVFAAGADLRGVTKVSSREQAHALGQTGHDALRLLGEMPVPSFAFINGVALGGGLEVALNCTYRTVASNIRALGLPETGLGLIPGWGGAYLLPRLVGIERAVDIILHRPAQNKVCTASEAAQWGMVDALLDPADFLEQSVIWAAQVLRGDVSVTRPSAPTTHEWEAAITAARRTLDATLAGARPAPYRAVDVMSLGPAATRDEGFAAEDDALADLIMTEEFRASIYAFHTVNAAKRPKGAPDQKLAHPIGRVGVVGAGLMAAQLAMLFAQKLEVPVVMRDLDEERVVAGVNYIRSTVERLVERGTLSSPRGAAIIERVRGTTQIADFNDCDLIIEAVTEVMDVKKKVFAELQDVAPEHAIFATNTSALSVTEMAAGLRSPERVVGLHFFNPVAKMPLVEVIRAQHTSDEALATGFAVVKKLGKTAVLVADRPGFVVNRLLVLLLGKIVEVVEQGTPVDVADRALAPLGLPMPPFALFDLVGPAVGLHVLVSLRENLGDRFPRSPGLHKIVDAHARVIREPEHRGIPARVDPDIMQYFDSPSSPTVRTEQEVLDLVVEALTHEVGLMLDEGVTQDANDIDVCMILGAGWPFALGGITPYLDRTGYSERITGTRFHPVGEASLPPV